MKSEISEGFEKLYDEISRLTVLLNQKNSTNIEEWRQFIFACYILKGRSEQEHMLNDLESVQGCLPSVRSEFRENDIEDTELSKLGELLDVLVHEVSSDIQSKTNRPSA